MTVIRPADQQGDIYVFAYGSLMWRPDFEHLEILPAVLPNYHRSLCIYSYEYRGTPEQPGLVFGLEESGECIGRALKVSSDKAEGVLEYLYEREMITSVYMPRWLDVKLIDSQTTVTACCFVADPTHEQFSGKLGEAETIQLILQGRGSGGECLDYVTNTYEHMLEIGIEDKNLARFIQGATEQQA